MSVAPVTAGSSSAAIQAPPAPPKQTEAPKQAAPAPITVNISKQAQQLAKDGDTAAQELKESGAEKASEKLRGKA